MSVKFLIYGKIVGISYSINDWKKSNIVVIVSSAWSFLIILIEAFTANGNKLVNSFYKFNRLRNNFK